MSIIHRDFEQGSEAWMLARCGVPTASEFGQIMTTAFEPRKGDMPRSYLNTKLAEKWIGGPLPGFSSWHTEQGQIKETDAIPFYCLEYDVEIERVGLILTDDSRVGCSPDGLICEDSGIEVKCVSPQNHIKYLLDGKLPSEHACQVHGSLYVSGRAKWVFLSYCKGFPPLVVTVQRDEEIMSKISDALEEFLAYFDRDWQRLCDANGGPPERTKREPSKERIKFSWEQNQDA